MIGFPHPFIGNNWHNCGYPHFCRQASRLFYPDPVLRPIHLSFITSSTSRLPSPSPFSIFFLLPLSGLIPAFRQLVFQTQIWAVALGSVTLKCISRKILPFCERVIFRKKRRKQLVRQPREASVNPKQFRRKKEPNRGK